MAKVACYLCNPNGCTEDPSPCAVANARELSIAESKYDYPHYDANYVPCDTCPHVQDRIGCSTCPEHISYTEKLGR